MTPEEVERFDLRHTCYHEHAHAAVAGHYGIGAHVEIQPTGTTDPLREKTWVGRCRFFGSAGGNARAMIALAGELAVFLLDDPELDPLGAHEYLDDPNALSPTDREMAGEYSCEDVEAALSLVRQHWPEIEQRAEGEILEFRSREAGEG